MDARCRLSSEMRRHVTRFFSVVSARADVGRCNLLETLHVDQCVHAFAHIWATNAFSNAGGWVSTWGGIWLQKRTQFGH